MQLSTNRRNLGKVAAILGVLQGLAWAGMSLAAIILYKSSPTLDIPETYTGLIGYGLYMQFIKDSGTSPDLSFAVRPFDFTIFMWVYFILSVGWIAVSIDQFTAIHSNKDRQKKILFLWGVVTLITALIDLIFTCLLARDYAECGQAMYNYDCYLIIGIAMTLAARGYTLWLVNVVFAFVIFHISINVDNNNKMAKLFSNHSIPRVPIPKRIDTDPTPRNGNSSPNYLNSESSYPSFLNHSSKFDTQDTLPSFNTRVSRNLHNDNNIPSFLNRGDKFGY